MISGFFLLYVLLKCGFDVMWVQYFSIFQLAVNNFIIKPIILCKYIPGYNCKYILKNAWQCIKVAIVPVSTSIILYNIYPVHSIFGMIIVSLILMLTVCISSLTFMKKEAQVKIFVYVMSKLHK